MPTLIIVCHNGNVCRDSLEKNPANPRPMTCTGETFSAWLYKCDTCGARRVVTKDQVGGTFGQGRRDDGTGPTTAKGRDKYRPGVTFPTSR